MQAGGFEGSKAFAREPHLSTDGGMCATTQDSHNNKDAWGIPLRTTTLHTEHLGAHKNAQSTTRTRQSVHKEHITTQEDANSIQFRQSLRKPQARPCAHICERGSTAQSHRWRQCGKITSAPGPVWLGLESSASDLNLAIQGPCKYWSGVLGCTLVESLQLRSPKKPCLILCVHELFLLASCFAR